MRNDTTSVLNDLIETSKDGEQGFTRAANETTDSELKTIFLQGAERCRTAVRQLQEHVTALGEKPESSGSALGAAHRGWLDLKAAVTGRDAKAILEECERGEDVAKRSYEKALQQDLPGDVRMVVDRQFREVIANHNRVKELRNITA